MKKPKSQKTVRVQKAQKKGSKGLKKTLNTGKPKEVCEYRVAK